MKLTEDLKVRTTKWWAYIDSKIEEAFLPSGGEVFEWPQNTKICPTSSVTELGKFMGVSRVARKNNKGIYVITQSFPCNQYLF